MLEQMAGDAWRKALAPLFPALVRQAMGAMPQSSAAQAREIRLRCARPIGIVVTEGERFLRLDGTLTSYPGDAVRMDAADCQRFFERIIEYSPSAKMGELSEGYVSLRGGYRVGLCGKVVVREGEVRSIASCVSFNIRIMRQILGVADGLMNEIVSGGRVINTLVLSPPGMGKTTLVRDITRQLGTGWQGRLPVKVGIVDERGEIAACHGGIPQCDVGICTDTLEGCPKAAGIMMMVRTMSPQVIVTDEIGRREDVTALIEAMNAGVAMVVTAHGESAEAAARRPVMRELQAMGYFQRTILLGKEGMPGRVSCIDRL